MGSGVSSFFSSHFSGEGSMRSLGILCVTYAVAAGAAFALPAGFKKEQIGSLDVAMLKCAPDGRVFVTEKNGKIRVIKNDVMLPAPFVNISSKVNNGQERGMLGIAVDPEFMTNTWVY